MNVLLVDDNIRAIEGLRRHLPWNETGCVCIGTASNGQEALELCRQLPVDIVVTDVRMPIMDGLELCKILRAELPGIQLIVISAYDEFDYAKSAIKYGVQNYILKPVNESKIVELSATLSAIAQSTSRYSSSMAGLWNLSMLEEIHRKVLQGTALEVRETVRRAMEPGRDDFKTAVDLALHLTAALAHQFNDLGLPQAISGRSLTQSMQTLMALHSFSTVVDFVVTSHLAVHGSIQEHKGMKRNKLVEDVKRSIAEHFSDPDISTYTIAKKFHISQSYLCSIFKESELTSINTMITMLRIEKAAGLLLNTSLSIQEIAQQIGYLDPHYLSRVFKKIKGLSPSEYRRLALAHEIDAPV